MNKNEAWAFALYNGTNMICWTALAIIFNKWWIASFAVFFMTSYKTKHQYYRICDNCGKHSPNADTYNGALDVARESGWTHIMEGNKDYCPECRARMDKEN